MLTSLALAFLAGTLSILSPCVLPLIPIIFGTAASAGRSGPLALCTGVVLSFVAIGLFVALLGFSIGFDTVFFRTFAAVLLVCVGGILMVPAFQSRFASAAGPVGDWASRWMAGFSEAGPAGQFAIGLLLGAVWSPCVGPTLGAASLLAARGESLGYVVLIMTVFGVGVAVPLLGIGLLSRELFLKERDRMLAAGSRMKVALGAVLVVTGLFILSGLDKAAEAALVRASPDWLTRLTTQF
ncbi:MAG: cytochrome c biogenesis protein CcdA [Rhizobiales bacterium]|nr:cytochrome c biogenesis protein CcdA [Hyphomicrobiales bacterium]